MSKANLITSNSRMYLLAAVAVLVVGSVLLYTFIASPSRSNGSAANQSAQTTNHTEDTKANNAYASISSDDIQRAGNDVDMMWEPETYPVVALVHIDSIDGGRTYSPVFGQYVAPQTYGKMTVREVYRGDVRKGDQLNYSRLGGIVTYDEYWKSLNKQQQDKILHLNNGKKPTEKEYIEVKLNDDINIETSKDYLVFLIPQSSKDNKHQEYQIGGAQFGLREAKESDGTTTALNNETKQWESVASIIKQE